MPAGNVLAEQVGPTLTLIGDDVNNQIRVLPGSQPNEVVVHGDGTTVNGSTTPQVFTGVENLFGHMLKGNDSLQLIGVNISSPGFSQVFVDGNAGSDRIELINTTIHAVDRRSADLRRSGLRRVRFRGIRQRHHPDSEQQPHLQCLCLRADRRRDERRRRNHGRERRDHHRRFRPHRRAAAFFHHVVVVDIFGDMNTSSGRPDQHDRRRQRQHLDQRHRRLWPRASCSISASRTLFPSTSSATSTTSRLRSGNRPGHRRRGDDWRRQ